MIKTKVYLYDTNYRDYRGEDFSANVLQGDEETEDITQELDTAEITLCGLTRKESFDPETKFIVDTVEVIGATENIVATRHWCVARDIVSQPILSDDNYFDHHISFIEPSVVAQKRLVDNISATYQLKSVSLDTDIPPYDTTQEMVLVNSPSNFDPVNNFEKTEEGLYRTQRIGKYFEVVGDFGIIYNDELIDKRYVKIYGDNQSGDIPEGATIKFAIPKIKIFAGINDSKEFREIGEATIDWLVEEFDLADDYNVKRSWQGTIQTPSFLKVLTEGTSIGTSNDKWLLEGFKRTQLGLGAGSVSHIQYRQYATDILITPPYRTINIDLLPDKNYTVKIFLHDFDNELPSELNDGRVFDGDNLVQQAYMSQTYSTTPVADVETTPLTKSQTTASFSFTTYSTETTEIVYKSSIPYSALALLQKAIVNSSVYEKTDGVYIADVNNSNLPFYIDPNFIDELSNTTTIENFYNQKNLWEIMLEVGHYIHAIPEIKFGDDDKFLITFNRLGRTDEQQSNSTKISIHNSRSVESYISATSSYVSNMVQLGGYIEEWVAPKTTNEQLLVANDTAEIIVSKPIIELLKVEVYEKSNMGNKADLTPFIYEENVYKTLSIDYDTIPNRGIALYYTLGTNVIKGGQYQLPQSSTSIFSDYTIKKVIWSAFNDYRTAVGNTSQNYWANIQINNYLFKITYRTKDEVRQNHSRPDLRKYLVNSQYDKFPEHNQFNNQTDVVVDSIKFGSNMYGKLIKTGNNSYEITEWNSNYENIKHKGELYRINGELYYVAKVKHYKFYSHIISTVTYSKDYNELSAVIGIPSEPRFYEISEQSLIRRNVAINDFVLLTDDFRQIRIRLNDRKNGYLHNIDHLTDLVFGAETNPAKYVVTVFKGDKDAFTYDQTAGEPDLYIEILKPLNAYASGSTLTYDWDMLDNFSAGDKVIGLNEEQINSNSPLDERAYQSLKAVPYTDIFGRASLMDFYIVQDLANPTPEQIIAQPEDTIIKTRDDDDTERTFIGDTNVKVLATNVRNNDTDYHGRGIGLLKDCREAISLNYNLQMITNSDTFVISPFVFSPNKKNIKVVLLREEVNKLTNGYISKSKIIKPRRINGEYLESGYFDLVVGESTGPDIWGNLVCNYSFLNWRETFRPVSPKHFYDNLSGEETYEKVKAIAVVCNVSLNPTETADQVFTPNTLQFVFARNIPSDWTKAQACRDIYLGLPLFRDIFTNKQ